MSITQDQEHIRNTKPLKGSEIIERTRDMILRGFHVEGADDVSVILRHNGFFLQVLFSSAHPLIVIYLAKTFEEAASVDYAVINEVNAESIMGSHSINETVGCYAFRSTHWLEQPMRADRFRGILARCSDEAKSAYERISGSCCK